MEHTPERGRGSELFAVLFANVVPLAGVALWDWSVAALAVLYWGEIGVVIWWSGVRALLAQRPSEFSPKRLLLGSTWHKRGDVPVPLTDATIRVRHLPLVVLGHAAFVLFWLVVAGLASAFVGRGGSVLTLVSEPGTVTTAVAGLFVIEGIATVRTYVLPERYEEVSAQTVARPTAARLFVIGGAVVLLGALVDRGVPTLLLAAVLVGARTTVEVLLVVRDQDWSFVHVHVFDEQPPERPPVDGELPAPVQHVRPRTAGILLHGALRGCLSVVHLVVVFALLPSIGLVFSGPSVRFLLFCGSAIAVVLAGAMFVGVIDYAIRHLTEEYRVSGDVVGYDRLLDEPQWRLSGRQLADVTPKRTCVDRLLGTETLVVEDGEREIRLPHLPETPPLASETRF